MTYAQVVTTIVFGQDNLYTESWQRRQREVTSPFRTNCGKRDIAHTVVIGDKINREKEGEIQNL